MKNIFTIVVAN